ncbi:hypothetical protein [Burkholderia pyrrocinia]|uniref:hypothetical protein n=1 Tax=Burkholderia pyrrocinia TaxID=60550 RepID=UPI001048BC51|nr:hypothetical protein [Burkholderia pyrrocinia]TDA48089.1 hypothetical protein EVG18_07320 [Burkholderia pyrrocinia]
MNWQSKVAVDVTLDVTDEADPATVATVVGVRDALGQDLTARFRAFADQEGFDLTDPNQVPTAAHKFAEKYAPMLP